MKPVIVFVLAAGCMHSESGTEGRWAPTTNPCLPVGDTTTIVSDAELSDFTVAGDTILFGSGSGIRQVSSRGGEPVTVALTGSAYVGPIGAIDDALVYYDWSRTDDRRTFNGVVLDRGLFGATSRYEWLGRGDEVSGLLVVGTGVHWSQRTTSIREDRRWDPATGRTTEFALRSSTPIQTNGTEFFFRTGTTLATQSTLGGPLQLIETERAATPAAISDDGELFFTLDGDTQHSTDLAALRRDGAGARILLKNELAGFGVVHGGHYYWTIENQIFRVPSSGGEVEEFYSGEVGTRISLLAGDACNLYWRAIGPEDRSILARTP